MKILVLSSQAFSLVKFRSDMMREMILRGNTVIAAAPDLTDEDSEYLAHLGVNSYAISLERNGINPLKDIYGFLSIVQLIKTQRPDILFLYQAKTVIYGALAGKLCGTKSMYAMICGLGSAFRSTGWRTSVIRNIVRTQYFFALACCVKVWFQNPDDLHEFTRLHIINPRKVEIINGSGVNILSFPQTPLPANDSFLFVGRLIRDKGIMEYLQAARLVKAQYPSALFRVVGYFDTNPTAHTPEQLQEYFSDGTAEYLGKQDDVYPFLRDCSVFVLPSYHEGTPKSVLEAMAVGRPIITTDAPGCRETVIEGMNGFLVPVGNTQMLAERMITLIENHKLVEEMALSSRRICTEKYDVREVNQRILSSMGLMETKTGSNIQHQELVPRGGSLS